MAIDLSPSGPVEPGAEITVTMSFHGLEWDFNRNDIDYIFRADVKNADETDADACEDHADGYGLGVDRSMRIVNQDPEVRRGKVSADCPSGDYTIEAVIASPDNVELASATASFTIAAPPTDTKPPTDTESPTDEACSGGGYNPTPTAVEVEAVLNRG